MLEGPQDCTTTSLIASAGTAAFAGSTTPRMASAEINEFQLYQNLRLKMVQNFGSLASALYECGADPETGTLPREGCAELVSSCLGMLTHDEASRVFSHVTNSDPLELGQASACTYRDFGISDEEWRLTTKLKKSKAMPFSSGPSGGSMGIYHRPISLGTLTSSREDGRRNRKALSSQPSVAAGTAAAAIAAFPSAAATGASMASASGFQDHKQQRRTVGGGSAFGGGHVPRRKGRAPPPWRQPQKPWAPSIFAGRSNEDEEGETITSKTDLRRKCSGGGSKGGRGDGGGGRGAAAEEAKSGVFRYFSSSAEDAARLYSRPLHAQLGEHGRGRPDVGHIVQVCPPRRAEMRPDACAQQVDEWWSYKGTPRPRRLHVLPLATLRAHAAATDVSAGHSC